MNPIKKRSFVIETKLPVKFANKKIMDDNQGEIVVPDPSCPTEYKYYWFAGVGAEPNIFYRTGHIIPMNLWTPYPSQAVKYSHDDAEAVYQLILGNDSGSWVVEWDKSHHKEGEQIIRPISAFEAAIQIPQLPRGPKPLK